MADGLTKYRSMRDFKSTPEPRGRLKRSRSGNLYIVQKHAATRLHYDFRLELDGTLLSWAVTRGPSLNPSDKRLAVRTEDHPIEYGGFEGVIPAGYGAGTVMLWDTGAWAPQGDPHEGLKTGNFKFVLMGERLKGGFALIRMKPKPGEKSTRENWLLVKERDQWVDEDSIATDRWVDSVKTGRLLQQIEVEGETYTAGKAYSPAPKRKVVKPAAARTEPRTRSGVRPSQAAPKQTPAKKTSTKNPARRSPDVEPAFIAPQLATLRPSPPTGDDWLHEIKFDGYRIIAVIHDGEARLFTRNAKDWTHRYKRVAAALGKTGVRNAVLDGELVAHDTKGKASFARMQAATEDETIPLVYNVFDLLNADGEDIRALPLLDRKERLRALLGAPPEGVAFSAHIEGSGEDVIGSACRLGLEGVISKRADAPYRSGRSLSWIKSKCIGSDEFVVGGYRLSDKRGRAFRSLLVGEFKDDKLVYRGRVGTGFSESTVEALMPKLKRLTRTSTPFHDTPADVRRGVIWVKPELVVQIAYLEKTPDGLLRHPSYLGLREDKPAHAVKAGGSSMAKAKTTPKTSRKAPAKPARAAKAAKSDASRGERPAPGALRLTSPDKLLWPDAGITKLDLAAYLHDMADHLLPHVKGRPLSLVRCPEGSEGECFFQKHHNASTPEEIETIAIREKNGGSKDYLIIRNATGLVATAQVGALELHVWGARGDSLEKPERLVFDLDPDEGLDFDHVKAAAFELRDVLDSVGLKSFALLTGGKGIHVIAPIARTRDWSQVKGFCSGLARKLAVSAPDRYVAQASKAKRTGRIFIDWLRNERGATAIAPFSPRRRPGAPVATPISWQELSGIDRADAFSMKTIKARLARQRSDPWKGYAAAARQALSLKAISAVGGD